MKIVVLDGRTLNPGDNPWDELATLGEVVIYPRTSAGEIAARIADADIVITNKALLTAPTLAAASRLKFIAVTATGYNVVDLAAAKAKGIAVANVPEYGTRAVAQFVFALLLELCHHVGRHDATVRQGQWAAGGEFSFWQTPQVELAGRTMGIVGCGRIGRQVAQIAQAFGMQVVVAGRSREPAPHQPFPTVPLSELFARADVVSLHCPLTAETAGMVNRALLERMKSTAMLLNTSRGGLVIEADLAEALRQGRLAGAAVDVVSAEPIAPDNPLLTAPHCLITPHMAWAALAARQRLMHTTVENVAAFLRGRPINLVNV